MIDKYQNRYLTTVKPTMDFVEYPIFISFKDFLHFQAVAWKTQNRRPEWSSVMDGNRTFLQMNNSGGNLIQRASKRWITASPQTIGATFPIG